MSCTVTVYEPFSGKTSTVELAPGDHVLTTWFGGNGPHEYEVIEYEGELHLAVAGQPLDPQARVTGPYAPSSVQSIEVTLPATVIHAAVVEAIVNTSRCVKSSRGSAAWCRETGDISVGYNAPPPAYRCAGTDACKRTCAKLCEHAEMMAVRLHPRTKTTLEVVHAKVVAGELVPSGGPSCISCARDLLVSGRVAAVWLFHKSGWRRYPIEEFHRLTMDACGIAFEEGQADA